MVFNCPKAATQHHNQHKQPYYEGTVMIRGRKTTVKIGADKQKIKTLCKFVKNVNKMSLQISHYTKVKEQMFLEYLAKDVIL